MEPITEYLSTTMMPLEDPAFKGLPPKVRDYLNLKASVLTARIAAAMAPRSDQFDPVVLVARALQLQSEVERHVIHERHRLARGMQREELQILLDKLGVGDEEGLNSHINGDRFPQDPVIGPALERRFMLDHEHLAGLSNEAFEFFSFEELAELNTWQLHPPYDFDDAMDIATNEPSYYLSVIKSAFDDLCILSEYKLHGSLRKRNSSDSSDAQREYIRRINRHRKITKDNIAPPDRIFPQEWMDKHVNKDQDIDIGDLAFLALIFRPYWENNRSYYLQEFENQSNIIERKTAGLGDGQLGRQKREGDKWVACSTEFIAFLKGRQISVDPRSAQEQIDAFILVYKKKPRKPQAPFIRAFFIVLLEALARPSKYPTPADILTAMRDQLGKLKELPFNSLTTIFIARCLDILRSAMEDKESAAVALKANGIAPGKRSIPQATRGSNRGRGKP